MNWLRPLAMMFYAPARGMSEVRDRSPLLLSLLLALLAQTAYAFFTQWQFLDVALAVRGPSIIFLILFQSVLPLLFLAIIFVPTLALLANIFERRGSFGLVIRQEYAPLASTVFYAWATANLIAIPLARLARATGLEAGFIVWFQTYINDAVREGSVSAASARAFIDPRVKSLTFAAMLILPLFAFWTVKAVREVFRLTVWRATLATIIGGIFMFIIGPVVLPLFNMVAFSPFWLIFLFILLRGHFAELTRGQRARASFKQNLEASTLNPADASAHYNLGLIYQQRGQLDEAQRSFERAIEIDSDEVDAHYQLGRIAREQNRLPDAINHFNEVVARDQTHSLHEIWREIGATYLAAAQFEDAREALERFLEHRTSDPQALYLMGRALAGLGRQREAADSMQACIEAVKTSPAYKYRTEKRWLNEAQQFLRSQA
ncbi:MAG TPA: tetratricopeptide repeat protein [Pyrinomonadaceae bacterium]|nr:tetratricopeptide repeat protein [Pyrinomonadaceae bacterium]